MQQDVGLAGGEVAHNSAGCVDAAGGLGGGACREVNGAGVDGGEDGSQDGDAGEAAEFVGDRLDGGGHAGALRRGAADDRD